MPHHAPPATAHTDYFATGEYCQWIHGFAAELFAYLWLTGVTKQPGDDGYQGKYSLRMNCAAASAAPYRGRFRWLRATMERLWRSLPRP